MGSRSVNAVRCTVPCDICLGVKIAKHGAETLPESLWHRAARPLAQVCDGAASHFV